MSSILKALKKLEEEKAAGRSGDVDITRDILRDGGRIGRHDNWLVPLLIGLLVLVGGAALYALLGTGGARPAVGSAPARTQGVARAKNPLSSAVLSAKGRTARVSREVAGPGRAAARPTAVAGATTAGLVVTEKVPAQDVPAVAAAAGEKASGQRPVAPPALKRPAVKSAPGVLSSAGTASLPPRSLTAPAKSPAQRAGRAKTTSSGGQNRQPAAFPALQLTEILFQKNQAARMAVVNDLPVMEGTKIAGATVLRIFPDHVRFRFKGRTRDVHLGAGGAPAP